MTRDKFPTISAAKSHLAHQLGVRIDVIGKTSQFGETQSILRKGVASTTDPKVGEDWYVVTAAGSALLNSHDRTGAVMDRLIGQTVLAGATPIRPCVAMLSFLRARRKEGVEWVHIADYASAAAVARETGWGPLAKKTADSVRAGVNPISRLRDTVIAANGPVFAAQDKAIWALRDLRGRDLATAITKAKKTLLPNSRGPRWDSFASTLAKRIEDNNTGLAAEWGAKQLCKTPLESILDMNGTYLDWSVAAQFIERRGPHGTGEVRITDFGVNALAAQPKKASLGARVAQEATTVFGFEDRQSQLERYRARCDELRKRGVAFDAALADVEWAKWAGRRMPYRYEGAVVVAMIGLVDMAESWNPVDGLRTAFNWDMVPIGAARGHGPDSYFTTVDGLEIIIEVTGNEGKSQISQEIEPVARHLRKLVDDHPDREYIGLFVAPTINAKFLAFYYSAGGAFDGDRPANIVPLDESQLRRVLIAGCDLAGLLREAVKLAPDAMTMGAKGRVAVDEFLAGVEDVVARYT